MGLSSQRRHWVISYHRLDCIVLLDESYRIVGWIVSYRMDWIVSYRLDQETLNFMRCIVTGWMVWMGRMGRMGRMGQMGR